jgi:hypothetical protein
MIEYKILSCVLILINISDQMSLQIAPTVGELLDLTRNQPTQAGKFVTIFSTFSLGDSFNPEEAFLKVRRGSHSFIFETATKDNTTKIQYSIIGTEPQKIITSGVDSQTSVDPFNYLEPELLKYQLAEHNLKKIAEPSILNGGVSLWFDFEVLLFSMVLETSHILILVTIGTDQWIIRLLDTSHTTA